jgi:hypothetical protein
VSRSSKYAHLWPLVEAMYLERIPVRRISQETGIPPNLISNRVCMQGVTDECELATTDRIAELKREFLEETR